MAPVSAPAYLTRRIPYYELLNADGLDRIEAHADRILDEWPDVLSQFVKVMPTDYKRVLAERRRHDEEIEATVHDADQTGSFVKERA